MDTDTVVDVATDVIETVAEHAEAAEVIVKNNPVVVVGVLVAGLAVGAAVSHVVTRLHLVQKYDRIMNKELQTTMGYYTKRVDDLLEKLKKYEEADEEERADIVNSAEIIAGLNEARAKEGVKVSYNKIAESYSDDDTEDGDEGSMEFDYEAEEKKNKKRLPHVIDTDSFIKNKVEHVQQTLTYYDVDEIFVNESDDIVKSPLEALGYDNLKFGYGSATDDTVYIRSPRFNMDFEVICINGSYADMVLAEQEFDYDYTNDGTAD